MFAKRKLLSAAALFAGAAAFAAATSANATVLVDEDFTYPDGNLTDNPAWVAHSGATGTLIQVDNGAAEFSHGSGSREDANIAFPTVTSGTLFFSFDFSVSDDSAISGSDSEYFAHFKDNTTSGFNARVDIVPATASGDFQVGIAGVSSTAEVTWGTDLEFDTVYTLVAGIDYSTGLSTLWIDPSASTDTSIVTSDIITFPGIESFALRGSNSSSDETITVDNLIVSTTFDEAIGVIPEPASMALVLAGAALLGARRRKA